MVDNGAMMNSHLARLLLMIIADLEMTTACGQVNYCDPSAEFGQIGPVD